jgi:hypothetical protein
VSAPKYIVATDRDGFFTRNQPAKLYKWEGYQNRYVLAGSGTVKQMEELAEQLNTESGE